MSRRTYAQGLAEGLFVGVLIGVGVCALTLLSVLGLLP